MPDSTISIEAKPALVFGDSNHSYLVYREYNEDGTIAKEEVIRGGPSDFLIGGELEVKNGVPLDKTLDAYKPGETPQDRYSTLLDLGGRTAEEVWEGMNEIAEKIGNGGINYDTIPLDDWLLPGTDPNKNCNSLTGTILSKLGIPVPQCVQNGVRLTYLHLPISPAKIMHGKEAEDRI